jgi:hypothetical protein
MTHPIERHSNATDEDIVIDKRNNTITFITWDYPAFVNNSMKYGMYKWFFFFFSFFFYVKKIFFFSDFVVVSTKNWIGFLFLLYNCNKKTNIIKQFILIFHMIDIGIVSVDEWNLWKKGDESNEHCFYLFYSLMLCFFFYFVILINMF